MTNKETMPSASYDVIVLPAKTLWNSTDAVKSCLFKLINQGYDKVRHKYQIILTPRIKNPELLFDDLGFQIEDERCLLYLLVRRDESSHFVAHFSETFVRLRGPVASNIAFYQPCVERLTFGFDMSRILAIIGYKPASESTFEMTGFTSLAKNCGALLAKNSLLHLKERFCPEKLIAHVVVDHELVGYYEKILGFTETSRFMFDVDSRNFEQSIKVSRNFHVAKLEKLLYYDI